MSTLEGWYITLGKTSIEDIRNKSYLYKKLSFDDQGDVCVTTFEGAFIWQWREDNAFTSVYVTRLEELFGKWKSLGFSWQLSYNEWIALFDRLNLKIEVKENPHIEVRDGRNALSAEFVATSPGRTIEFTLHFSSGNRYNEGYSRLLKYSLYSIKLHYKS